MASAGYPKVMKALVVQEGYRVAVQNHPVPPLGDDDILVKTVAVAQNPTDWKFVDSGRANPGAVLGCDWSGHVTHVGQNVAAPRVGAHVAGFVMGATFADSGAYAEYVRTPAELAWAVPEGTLSHAEAATMGCAFWTAVQALYHPRRLGLVEPPARVGESDSAEEAKEKEKEEWVYIHGGSSSVGQFAIQLAVLSGYKVVTTASPRNFALVRALNAAAVFDYHSSTVVAEVKAAAGDAIRAALDTIGERAAQEISVGVVVPAAAARVVHVLQAITDVTARTDVVRGYTIIYSALGRAYTYATGAHAPAVLDDRAHMVAFLKKVPGLVKEGKIKPLPVKLWEGGLSAIPDGLQFMKEGKVSAEKIVYRV